MSSMNWRSYSSQLCLFNYSTSPVFVVSYLRQCIQTTDGMAFLHSAKYPILHRDLRSANILIEFNGKAKVIIWIHSAIIFIMIPWFHDPVKAVIMFSWSHDLMIPWSHHPVIPWFISLLYDSMIAQRIARLSWSFACFCTIFLSTLQLA